MLLDLDRFKEINDTLGHHYGDEVLRQVGERLSSLLREEDTVARLGGDEFAILLRSVETPAAGVAVAAAVRRAIAEPFDVAGVRLELGASVGIASYPEHGHDVDVLMQRADVAMYQAKEGRTGVERYVPELDGNSVQRLALAGDLRTALEREEFVLHYQPKVDLRTNAVIGAEVLLRWAHPVHGWLPPDEFIPLAEHTGLIVPLTNYVFDHALRQMGAWRAQGLDLGVAVNLSARTLIERDLPDRIEAMCQRWAVPTSAPRARDHREHGRGRPGPRAADPRAAARAGRRDRGRRLRDRLLLDGLPQAPAGQRGQDRPLVRHDDGERRARRRHRALHDRPRPQPRAARRRRGRRDARRACAADRAGLRPGPGLLVLARAAGRRVHSLARRARAAARWRSARTAASAAGRSATRTIAAPAAAAVERGPATTIRS